MNGLLIFDHLNDVVYTKYNEEFIQHINNFAIEQEILPEEVATNSIDVNILIQAFSPIVTSHRIMSCQFGNSYTSIECENNLTVYFEDYMGYLFLAIGKEKVDYMQRFTKICVTIVRYLCGPDVYQLKTDNKKSKLTNELIDNWRKLICYDQSVYVEAVEQLFINSELSSTSLKILRESVDNISAHVECKKVHGLILVQNKILSLYSSASAKELAPSDILFLTILCQSLNLAVEGTYSQPKVSSYQLLLSGPEDTPKCLPHAVHILPQTNGIHLVYLVEIGNSAVSASLYESFSYLHTLQQVQIQRDNQTLQSAFENLELATKRLHDSLKKTKNVTVDNSHKQLMKKWDIIKKKYQEFLKNNSEEALLRAETLALGFLENLKQLFSLTSVDDSILSCSAKYVIQAALKVKEKITLYEDFFKVKSIKNFSIESRDSLTINKYLEEFPGLVHFLYVDRNSHRITTPTLDLDTEEGRFNKKKIWLMLSVAKSKLQNGLMSIIWKDLNYSYAYFLWFEDTNGQALKPVVFPEEVSGWPGILCEDFYQKLRKICFPKTPPSKVRCYEVFCLHLGLVTASLVLEQTRRLAATISELRGYPPRAVDFF
ncbi:BLOC-3 complex member HPS1 isoform X1 [Diorhabda sublineata]|uniref:BLOC-3 complex member HPS1 isoform X1 n=1 Tax=Diorhabda sublineata TaxID=1163346 RepID=UPI0024E17878|nr:BLOC-3 complex member HPS1 isoform X1 [Diorhabda sublineata]